MANYGPVSLTAPFSTQIPLLLGLSPLYQRLVQATFHDLGANVTSGVFLEIRYLIKQLRVVHPHTATQVPRVAVHNPSIQLKAFKHSRLILNPEMLPSCMLHHRKSTIHRSSLQQYKKQSPSPAQYASLSNLLLAQRPAPPGPLPDRSPIVQTNHALDTCFP